ncbi:MAG TPA: 6,7-dimethyl-8-ribityllumazine synthase [Bacteroidales bacterium]|jgi:6,7-dimethyl-8-ribityllumazine synthase|nr:6,7-dimethyl-8-ribityllumazine synthase [Bacteroidales bacterium]HOS16298.1 6,7-dimethyl-8-ribityllumazine synthase [Bacteroidales bacterium]
MTLTKEKNLSNVHAISKPCIHDKRIGIVTAQWNPQITEALRIACVNTLLEHHIKETDITQVYAPGSYELPFVAKQLINRGMDAVICLGCIIQGETRHFDFIADATANGIMNVGLQTNTPVIFGVLTTNNMEQALDRAGGKHGNKGIEAAMTCLKMLEIE